MKSWLIGLAAAAIAASGCGNSNSSGGTTATTAAGSGGNATSGAGGGGGKMTTTTGGGGAKHCTGPEPALPNKMVPIGSVKVRVEDAAKVGLGDSAVTVQLCGTELCLKPDAPSSDGNYTFTGKMGQQLTDPALKYGSLPGADYLFWGGVFTMGPTYDYGTVNAIKLGPSGGKLVKGTTVTSNSVAVAFSADALIEIETSAADGDFRAAVFKPSDGNYPPLAATTTKFDMLVGMGPAEVDICPPARLTFPNSANLPAKAAVELWLNGVKTYEHWVPYGSWAKVADGVVSDDGKTISTKDGSGIPALGAYGVVKK